MSRKRFTLLLAAAGVLFAALPASAHVTVHSDATKGGHDGEIVFRVPNEEASATTKLEIALPVATPIAGVYPENKPGWTFTVKTSKLATPIKTDDGDIGEVVVDVVWTATGGGIPKDGYEDFTLAAGLLPDVESIAFKAVQTYKDGDVVRWIETGSEADHPAPVLTLAGETTTQPTPARTLSASPVPAVNLPSAKLKDDSARTLGGAGLAAGAVAFLVAVGALVRGRKA
ncbi:MAG: hypothetical protein JWO22_885 [Frankiales bacterium]|nr:hypothetical protein [Frankiales bacterium]